MARRPSLIIAAAAVLVMCRAAAHHGQATIVRDGKSGSSNPAVMSGGQRLPSHQPPAAIPYSLIGALWRDDQCYPPFAAWPLGGFGSFDFRFHSAPEFRFHGAPGRVFLRSPFPDSVVRIRRPVP
jgi:hypothetical protein